MSPPTNRGPLQVYEEQLEAFDDQDVERLVSLWAEDGILIDMHAPDTEMRGKDAYREYLTQSFGHLADISSTTISVAIDGNLIAAETEVRATFQAEPGAADGAKTDVVLHYCLVEVIEDGLVRSEHVYSDSAELARQL